MWKLNINISTENIGYKLSRPYADKYGSLDIIERYTNFQTKEIKYIMFHPSGYVETKYKYLRSVIGYLGPKLVSGYMDTTICPSLFLN